MLKQHVLLAVLSAFVFSLVGQAADPAWKPLFDGKTLDGWIQKNGTGTYRVVDGAILGETAKSSPNSFLCTVEDYGDFELEFEVKLIDSELNSGVQIRSQTKPIRGDKKFESHPKGFIGLQVHSVGNKGPYQVAWRNIRIKELDG